MTTGPCDICKEISSFGALGMPCRPQTCQCICHRKTRALAQRETQKVLGEKNMHIVNEIKYGIPNPMQMNQPSGGKKKKFWPTGGMRSMNHGRL